ncbi:UNVERIFIED_CONTAM: Endonuclease V [Sesamum radiatum]|uniref:Endonuclease V n=1 Tax=Sesamum radiatum TaxID=300843 RepID=A0AAW2L217_SESRA
MEEDASTSGNTNISPQLLNEWIEIQDSLKKRLITDDQFDWKLPPMEDQDSEGIEENQDSDGEILKYVGGVDLSFSRNDSLIACATLVVLDISTLEVVREDSSITKLRNPYVPGFLAFREAMQSTKGSLKPIFISVGHRVSLPSAIKIVKLCGRFRVPEPIRQHTIINGCHLT